MGGGRRDATAGLCAALAAALAAVVVLLTPAPAGAAEPRLEPRALPLSAAKLFDLSVADVEGDGDYDLFSTNHKYRGSLMLSGEAGTFSDGLDASGLSATNDVPGFDDLFREPVSGPAGLYIWVDREGFTHLRTVGLGTNLEVPSQRVSGEIRFFGREVTVERALGAEAALRSDPATSPPTSVVSFDAGPDSELVLRARFMDLPFAVSIDPTFRRSRILLGHRLAHPPASEFGFDLGDRHGVAWADFDQDGATDAYIANGGNRGAVRRFGEYTKDELYWGDGAGHFTEDIERTGIEKGFCRGRYAAPVDYDGDGQLDIFIGCEQTHPLLLRQRTPGKFGSRSHELAAARVHGDIYRWLDLDGDRIPELISIRRRKVRVYDPGTGVYDPDTYGGAFTLEQSLRASSGGRSVDSLSFADLDGDGDPDLFLGSRGGNSVLLNRRGSLEVREPAELGLPPGSTVASSFVDFDNDGRIDFHAVPQGLFRQKRDGTFESTGAGRVGARARFAASSWFDLDGDGDRDLVSALKRSGARLRTQVFENRTRGGHWLEVDLHGPTGNAEAIGARVVVSSSGAGRQTQWVGQAEGSRFSSGHYRTYFGLGDAAVASRVQVVWPDGTRTTLSDVAADRVLPITYPG